MKDAKYKQVESIPEFVDSIRLRVDVFIKEQGYAPGMEPDEDDKRATSYIALVDGEVVSSLRVREVTKGEMKIERMVTRKDFRGKGVGKGLLLYVVEQLRKQSPHRIWLRSQVRAQKFYEKCGLVTCSEIFTLFDIPHVDMELP